MYVTEAFKKWYENERIKYDEGETVSEVDVAMEAFIAGVDFVCDKWEASLKAQEQAKINFMGVKS